MKFKQSQYSLYDITAINNTVHVLLCLVSSVQLANFFIHAT